MGSLTPEQQARREIDRILGQCGWIVQDYADMLIAAGLGVAVREFPLKTGPTDYLLYADQRAIGVGEAKPEGHTLTGVETQSARYAKGFPDKFPCWRVLSRSPTSPDKARSDAARQDKAHLWG